MSRSRLSSLSIGALLLCAACAGGVREYRCARPTFRDAADPAAVWRCNRDVLARVSRGKKFSIREYREAAGFMERLTGITAGSVQTSLGPLPPRDLSGRLPEWDAWFLLNRERLRWDPESGRVVAGTENGEDS